MNLDESQKKTVTAWITDGLKLADIQKRMGTELGVNLTYMEVRMLVDDLKLMPKDPAPPKVDKPVPPPQAPAAAEKPLLPDDPNLPAPLAGSGSGNVSLTVDALARAGTLISGNVQFSDGQSAAWYMDQMGRLGLAPKQQGYKPSAADLQSFQQGLEAELSKLGL
jgi:hypothetical protein